MFLHLSYVGLNWFEIKEQLKILNIEAAQSPSQTQYDVNLMKINAKVMEVLAGSPTTKLTNNNGGLIWKNPIVFKIVGIYRDNDVLDQDIGRQLVTVGVIQKPITKQAVHKGFKSAKRYFKKQTYV